MFEAFAENVVELEYEVAALPVIQDVMLDNVPEELPRKLAAFAVKVATFAAKPDVV
jgi:hypothetical protein